MRTQAAWSVCARRFRPRGMVESAMRIPWAAAERTGQAGWHPTASLIAAGVTRGSPFRGTAWIFPPN
jgi:hypothetical protein